MARTAAQQAAFPEGDDEKLAAMKAQQEEMRRRMEVRRAKRKGGAARRGGEGRPAEPPAPWRLTSHPSSPGQWYYYNTETGETQWEPPAAGATASAAAWKQVKHPATGQFYYYNEATRETTWDRPAAFEAPAEEGARQKNEQESSEDAVEEESQEVLTSKPAEKLDSENERKEEVVEAKVAEPQVEAEPTDREIMRLDIDEAALAEESKQADQRLTSMKRQASSRRQLMLERRRVFEGKLTKTRGGLTKDDLMINKRGTVVSKKQHERGMQAYAKYLKAWSDAVKEARSSLEISGFQAVGGASEAGQRLLQKSRAIYEKLKKSGG